LKHWVTTPPVAKDGTTFSGLLLHFVPQRRNSSYYKRYIALLESNEIFLEILFGAKGIAYSEPSSNEDLHNADSITQMKINTKNYFPNAEFFIIRSLLYAL
jgi:hypothetical protein